MSKKILGICGSPRRKSGSEYILDAAMERVSSIEGIQTETILLSGKTFSWCIHCDKCLRDNSTSCSFYKDDLTELYDRFYNADGYFVVSPVYEMNITAPLVAYLNRFRPAYNILKENPAHFSSKVGAAAVVGGTRNGGQEFAVSAIHNFYNTMGIMIVNGGMGAYSGGMVWSQDKKAKGAEEDTVGMERSVFVAERLADALLSRK